MSSHVMAQYTIRSKQEYIFRSNRLREITGASHIIADCFKLLYDRPGFTVRQTKAGIPFSLEKTLADFETGECCGEELFTGGGNCTLLLKDMETYCALNRSFTRELLKKFPGLIPMAVAVPCTGDYDADYKALMKKSETEKNRMTLGQAGFCAPFAQMDRTTNQPLSALVLHPEKQMLTAESLAKRKKGEDDQDDDTKLLDDMITQKGTESLLAVVHADGNNMGVKIQDKLKGRTDYTSCVNAMREFTTEINNAFVETGKAALAKARKAALEKHSLKQQKKAACRIIVADGDDFTFICNARLALEYTRAYLEAVTENKKEGGEPEYSSCAGICIFHSGYPVARAYTLAEQACDNAKDPVHKSKAEECWLDFHYIHAGIDGDLEEIRTGQNTARAMARPWRAAGDTAETVYTLQNWDKLAAKLTQEGSTVSRTNLKTLAAAWESSPAEGRLELERISYRQPELKEALKELFGSEENALKALYDFTEAYDLWVSRQKEG